MLTVENVLQGRQRGWSELHFLQRVTFQRISHPQRPPAGEPRGTARGAGRRWYPREEQGSGHAGVPSLGCCGDGSAASPPGASSPPLLPDARCSPSVLLPPGLSPPKRCGALAPRRAGKGAPASGAPGLVLAVFYVKTFFKRHRFAVIRSCCRQATWGLLGFF